jgi:hypothetical protein
LGETVTEDEFLAEGRELRERADEQFRAAREEVVRVREQCPDKEPFSIEGLERELNEFGETTLGFSRRDLEEEEHSYYLFHGDMTTLAELARAIAMNYPSRPSAEALDRVVEERKRGAPNKEPFSERALRRALGSRDALVNGLSADQIEWYELSYYLHHPDTSTLAEFAATVTGALARR